MPRPTPESSTLNTRASTTATPTKRPTKTPLASSVESPSELISKRIAELSDWRGTVLAQIRALILQADSQITEDWKWRGVPVWYRDGMICTGESYKSAIKLTFAKGASLADPSGLFNSSLDGNARRAIDIHETDVVDGEAFQTLIRAAIALNSAAKKKR